MLFSDIPTYQSIKQKLISSVLTNKVPHCQLFYSERDGIGLPIALAYAKYILCKNRTTIDSCNRCNSCKKFISNSHPDIYYVYPTSTTKDDKKEEDIDSKITSDWHKFISNIPSGTAADWAKYLGKSAKNLNIPKSSIYTLTKWLSTKPFDAKYKICIIWLVEYTTIPAANTYLKTLEEPTPDTIFLLISHDRESIIDTVLSRSQQFFLPRTTASLKPQNLVPPSSVQNVYEPSKLSPDSRPHHLSTSNLEEHAQNNTTLSFKEWIRYCYKKDFYKLLSFAENFQKANPEEQKAFLKGAMDIARGVYFCGLGLHKALQEMDVEDYQFLEKLSKFIAPKNVEYLIESLDEACYCIDRNANPKTLIINLSLQIKW